MMERQGYADLIREVSDQVEEAFPWDILDEIDNGVEPLLLDIRCPHEFQVAHIAGSINVPRGILELACDYGYEETIPELVEARDRRVVVICRSTNRSILAAHTLSRMGFQRPVSLKTGLRGWNDYEQPLRRGDGETLTLDEADEYFLSRVAPDQLGPLGSKTLTQGGLARPQVPVLSRYHQEPEHQNLRGGLRQ
jgi:rhodanese-related sulfurtransferase